MTLFGFPLAYGPFRTTGETQAARGHGPQGARGRAHGQALALALAWVQRLRWLRGSPVALPPAPPLQVVLQVRVFLGSFFCAWRGYVFIAVVCADDGFCMSGAETAYQVFVYDSI